jgi:hypothetical protein
LFRRLFLLGAALVLGCGAALPRHSAAQPVVAHVTARPRLVVVISIDQFRADLVTRFEDLYLPPGRRGSVGGFRYLQERGAWYPDCRYQHHRTVTGAGHSIIGSGAQPSVSGVVGNNWWDARSGKRVYCTDDPRAHVVGAAPGSKATPMSPANQMVTTFIDELELATGGQAHTVSVSVKDRAAIMMAGHRADTAIWFDENTGGWISSDFYCKSGKLPAWVEALNARREPDRLRGAPWEPGVDSDALARVWNPKGGPVTFSHPVTGATYTPLITSPAGDQLTLNTAEQAVEAESLGQDDVPDALTINLASNDYVGHKYGPDSAEVLDMCVQTDRMLAGFFNYLERAVPGGLARVTLAVTADHGVAPVPEVSIGSGVPAGRLAATLLKATAQKALEEGVGPGDWIIRDEGGELYFNPAVVSQYPQQARSRLERLVVDRVRELPGVYFAIGKSAVLAGEVPRTPIGNRISLGVHPLRSGDVIVLTEPQWLTGTGTASHGTPFTYDAHVPLLMAGFGVRPGTYRQPVAPAQIAPTMAYLLGTARPSGAEEGLLPGIAGLE